MPTSRGRMRTRLLLGWLLLHNTGLTECHWFSRVSASSAAAGLSRGGETIEDSVADPVQLVEAEGNGVVTEYKDDDVMKDEDSCDATVLEETSEEEEGGLDKDTEDEDIEEEEEDDFDERYTFSLYQENDGSKEDEDGIPKRFLVMAKGKRPAAQASLQHTLDYRKEHGVDTILTRPHPQFDLVKSAFPHYFAGRDPSGNPILVQRPGMLDLEYVSTLGLTHDDLEEHMTYVLEYCWNVVEPRGRNGMDYGVMTSVVDLTGVTLSNTIRAPATMRLVKRIVSMMSHNYPSRSHSTLLINAPRWFGTLYGVIKPLLRESTRQKIQIHSGGKPQDAALVQTLGAEAVPKQLLSTSKDGGSDAPASDMEKELRDFCLSVLERHDVPMMPIPEKTL